MPSAVSSSSTSLWASVQSSFASHHSASSGAERPSGGIWFGTVSRNCSAVMTVFYHQPRQPGKPQTLHGIRTQSRYLKTQQIAELDEYLPIRRRPRQRRHGVCRNCAGLIVNILKRVGVPKIERRPRMRQICEKQRRVSLLRIRARNQRGIRQKRVVIQNRSERIIPCELVVDLRANQVVRKNRARWQRG